MPPDRKHVEPVDADRARRQFDDLALTGQPVRALASDLDRADRGRNLGDLAAQRGQGRTDLRRR